MFYLTINYPTSLSGYPTALNPVTSLWEQTPVPITSYLVHLVGTLNAPGPVTSLWEQTPVPITSYLVHLLS